jgi:hypothetical protein
MNEKGEGMAVQKIANMKSRLERYEAESRKFWREDFVPLALIGLVICFGGSYLLTRVLGFDPVMGIDWRAAAACIWVLSLVPFILMKHPKKPTPSDVARDQALRRAFGMDDTVEK